MKLGDTTYIWEDVANFIETDDNDQFGMLKVAVYIIPFIPSSNSIELKFIAKATIDGEYKIYGEVLPHLSYADNQTLFNISDSLNQNINHNGKDKLQDNEINANSEETECDQTERLLSLWKSWGQLTIDIYNAFGLTNFDDVQTCILDIVNTYHAVNDLLSLDSNSTKTEEGLASFSFVASVVTTLIDCAAAVATKVNPTLKVVASSSKLARALANIPTLLDLTATYFDTQKTYDCFGGPTDRAIWSFIKALAAFDPNEKVGKSDITTKNYVSKNSQQGYTVLFENLETASLAAQQVFIYDTLDLNKYDLSSFQFKSFGFSGKSIILPSNLKQFSEDVDLQPNLDLIVRVNGSLDTVGGIIKWEFISFDPQTMELIDDQLLGFLPPNQNSPEGEGFVSYSIALKDSLSTGTKIRNRAKIVFDYNPPILTNEWILTLDTVKPVSTIYQLPETIFKDTINIFINGNDVSGEILKSNILIKENDSTFFSTDLSFPDTLKVKLKYDTTYYFRSIAVDYAGNFESAKTVYDTYTTVRKLNPPTLLLPADSTFLVDVRPLFVWDSAQYSLKYQLQLSDTSDFSNLIIDNQNLIGQSYQATNSFQYNKKFYWRMRSINGDFNSAWSPIFSFTTIKEPANVPDSWAFTDSTGISSQIVIPTAVMPKIGDRYISKGDAVGLFFTRNDSLVCAGYGVWNSQDLNITVWGDNPATQMKDGFATNEVYIFRVWDAQQSRERKGLVEYESGNNFFTNASNSILKKLYTNETQSLIVKQGWNYISTYILPENPTLENLFANNSDNLLILKTIKGQTYIPQYEINTIGNWNNFEAYQGYFTQLDTINIGGETIIPEDSPIILNIGWSLVPYLRNINGSVEDNLNSIVENDGGFLIAKTITGSVYIPSYGINTIGSLKPGDGYQMYLSRKDTLIYPANSFGKLSFGKLTPNPKYLEAKYSSTGSSSNLIIITNANEGDEFGIYNQKDELIGSGIVHHGKAAITIWGDNDQTEEMDGAELNEELSLKHYNIKNGLLQEIDLQLTNQKGELISSVLRYKNDGISFAKVNIKEIIESLSLEINPNPATSSFEISYQLGNANNCSIVIYNNNGFKIDEITNLTNNKYTYNSNKLSSGIYTVILNCDEQVLMRKLVIAK